MPPLADFRTLAAAIRERLFSLSSDYDIRFKGRIALNAQDEHTTVVLEELRCDDPLRALFPTENKLRLHLCKRI